MKKCIFLTACIWLSISIYGQDTLHVPSEYTSIQLAIDSSLNGDIVLVDTGIYYENIVIFNKNITLGSKYILSDDTSYISQTIIDGSLSSNVLIIGGCDSTLKITGFTIQNGWEYYGAGIKITSGGILDNLVIKDNIGFDPENQLLGQAPGIYCNGGNGLKLRNIIFENNFTSSQACALWCRGINNGELSNLTFRNNQTAGLGIDYVALIQESDLDINNIEFSNNHGFDRIISFGGTPYSYFVNNLFIHDNTSNFVLVVGETVAYFMNTTIVNNVANYYLLHGSSFTEIYNSILWNTSNNPINPDQLYVKIENSCYNNALNELENISGDPLFMDESNQNYHLSDSSPCIGSAYYENYYPTDIDGNPRPSPVGSVPDMGVFESNLGNVSINELTVQDNEYSVYPNPVVGNLNVQALSKNNLQCGLFLYDLQGKILVHKTFRNNILLDVNKINPGVYILSVKRGKNQKNHKIIIYK